MAPDAGSLVFAAIASRTPRSGVGLPSLEPVHRGREPRQRPLPRPRSRHASGLRPPHRHYQHRTGVAPSLDPHGSALLENIHCLCGSFSHMLLEKIQMIKRAIVAFWSKSKNTGQQRHQCHVDAPGLPMPGHAPQAWHDALGVILGR